MVATKHLSGGAWPPFFSSEPNNKCGTATTYRRLSTTGRHRSLILVRPPHQQNRPRAVGALDCCGDRQLYSVQPYGYSSPAAQLPSSPATQPYSSVWFAGLLGSLDCWGYCVRVTNLGTKTSDQFKVCFARFIHTEIEHYLVIQRVSYCNVMSVLMRISCDCKSK